VTSKRFLIADVYDYAPKIAAQIHLAPKHGHEFIQPQQQQCSSTVVAAIVRLAKPALKTIQ